MGSANLQAKIKKGLAKAVNKTGSTASEKVFLLRETRSGGTPLTTPIITTESIELLNAIFRKYNISLVGANIQAGDRELISDSDVTINTGDTIRQGSTNYIAIGPSPTAPTSDVLLYKTQVRVK